MKFYIFTKESLKFWVFEYRGSMRSLFLEILNLCCNISFHYFVFIISLSWPKVIADDWINEKGKLRNPGHRKQYSSRYQPTYLQRQPQYTPC